MEGKIRRNDPDVKIEAVMAAADRMVWTGRLFNTENIDSVRQCLALWKARRNPAQVENIHIAALSPEVREFPMEAFEKRVTSLEEKLEARSSHVLADEDLLVKVNERQAAQIEALMLALSDAEGKITDQEKRIRSLRKQIGFQQQALAKAKRRIGGAGLETGTLRDH